MQPNYKPITPVGDSGMPHVSEYLAAALEHLFKPVAEQDSASAARNLPLNTTAPLEDTLGYPPTYFGQCCARWAKEALATGVSAPRVVDRLFLARGVEMSVEVFNAEDGTTSEMKLGYHEAASGDVYVSVGPRCVGFAKAAAEKFCRGREAL